jgi:Domain of unknown function (DUF4281)
MTIELFFGLSALVVAPFWLMMIGLPSLSLTRTVINSPLILLPLPLLYTVLLVANWGLVLYLIDHPTLTGLAVTLYTPAGALIAWVHVLALDLFVGRWIYLDSRDRRIPALGVVPVLWLTLLAGPAGLMFYLLFRPLVPPPKPAANQAESIPSIAASAPSPASMRKPAAPGTGQKTL